MPWVGGDQDDGSVGQGPRSSVWARAVSVSSISSSTSGGVGTEPVHRCVDVWEVDEAVAALGLGECAADGRPRRPRSRKRLDDDTAKQQLTGCARGNLERERDVGPTPACLGSLKSPSGTTSLGETPWSRSVFGIASPAKENRSGATIRLALRSNINHS